MEKKGLTSEEKCPKCGGAVEAINIAISGFLKFEATDQWDYWCPVCKKEFDKFTVECQNPINKRFFEQHPEYYRWEKSCELR